MYSRNLTTRDCPLCGVSVFVHRNQDYIPISMPGLIIGNLADRSTPVLPAEQSLFAYIPHICEPGDVEAHDSRRITAIDSLQRLIEDMPHTDTAETHVDHEWRRENLARLNALRDDRSQIQQELLEMVNADGLTRSCPKCDVEIGRPCENLTSRRQGRTKVTKHPHAERLPRVDYSEIDPDNDAQVEIKSHIDLRNNISQRIDNLYRAIDEAQEVADLARLRDEIREIVNSLT